MSGSFGVSEEYIAALLRAEALLNFDEAAVARFMVESNAIEGESGLNPNDVEAAMGFLHNPMTLKALLKCHGSLAAHLKVDWAGKLRDCCVSVGRYVAPPPEDVPAMMRKFFRELHELDSWTAHNKFQKIHPFRDLNGRTGRLIWLHRGMDEGYSGRIGFLHKYYYQTLERQK